MAEGLVRAIGVSNASLAQVEELLAAGSVPPAVNQVGRGGGGGAGWLAG